MVTMPPKKQKKAADNPWPDRLVKLRARLKLSQTQAAEKVGVSRRSWYAWETGQQIPSRPLAILIDLLDQGKI